MFFTILVLSALRKAKEGTRRRFDGQINISSTLDVFKIYAARRRLENLTFFAWCLYNTRRQNSLYLTQGTLSSSHVICNSLEIRYSVHSVSVLFCSILFYSILFCSILSFSILPCSILSCSILSCWILPCSIPSCSVLIYSVLFCNLIWLGIFLVWFCKALSYPLLSCSILVCSTDLYKSVHLLSALVYFFFCDVLFCFTLFCSVLFWYLFWLCFIWLGCL